MCRPCVNLRSATYIAKNAGQRKETLKRYNNKPNVVESGKKYRELRKDTLKEKKKRYAKDNRDKTLASAQRYRTKHREKKNLAHKEYKKKNPHIINEQRMRRIATQKQGSLNNTFHKETQAVYKQCIEMNKATGVKHQVDHIIPILCENVSGLHVPWNLQVLNKEENQKKSNKFDGTYNNESWRKNATP